MELYKITSLRKNSAIAVSKDKEIEIIFNDIMTNKTDKIKYDKNNIKIGDYLDITFLTETEFDFGVCIPQELLQENQNSPHQDPNNQRRSKTEPPASSSPLLQLGPIGLHRQELKDLGLPERVLKALETRFPSYRHSRLDTNSFYRATGIAILEYISGKIATTEFKKNIYNTLLDARRHLSDYWTVNDNNENWLKVIGWLIDLDEKMEFVEKLEYLENTVYISTAYDCEIAMISMVRFLIAVWIFNNSESDAFTMYGQPYQEAISEIMSGGQPGENHIVFLSHSIGAEINITQVNSDHRVNNRCYSPEKENLINFIEVNDTFYPAFSYEQIYFESNERDRDHLEPFKGLNGEYWPIEERRNKKEKEADKNSETYKNIIQLFLNENAISGYPGPTLEKIKEMIVTINRSSEFNIELLDKAIEEKQCEYCFSINDVVTLKCQNKVCRGELINFINQDTKGFIVINKWEKENLKDDEDIQAKCPICNVILDEETIELVINNPELFQKYKEASIEREKIQNPPKITCKCCLEEKLEAMFVKDKELECLHVCWECMFENIRRNNLECPECNIKYSEAFRKKLKYWKFKCCYCNENKSAIKEFSSGFVCETHKLMCLSCLEQCYEWESCMPCNSKLSKAELEKLNEIIHKECTRCGKPYKRSENLEKKDCFCNICENCQCESIDFCITCKIEFSDGIKNILAKKKEDKNEEERIRRKRMRECGVCQQTFMITDMRGLDCDHYFCENCLAEMLKYYIENRQLEKATKCPHEGCEYEISANILQNILSPELWDKLNTFIIDQKYNMVCCPDCKNKFEAPNSRKAICIFCKCEFCRSCSDKWHEDNNCEEIYIQRRIVEMEEAGEIVSQCPGCKQPYIKDDHCEHVECMNPKCKTVFCFTCACLRSPTMAHGNHFHRPECNWFQPLPAADKDRYMPNHCDECKRLGELCKPPMRLAVPRKFAPGEV